MTRVRFEISMSLDGYVTADNPRLEEPMGDGGQVLHEWAFGDDGHGNDVHADSQDTVDARKPTIIVSHSTPENAPPGGVYTFVRSPQEAVQSAKAIAADKDVDIVSASIGGQLLRAGLVDEVRIHIVPVLLGAGTRLLDDTGGHIRLEPAHLVAGAKATHLRYAVVSTS